MYNENNNRGNQMNRNNNENNVNAQAQKPEQTCTCCEEATKKTFGAKLKGAGQTITTTVKNHPVETAGALVAAAMIGGYTAKGLKRKKEGKSFWHIPLAESKPVVWLKAKFGKKAEKQPEAPATTEEK
jgi:hypothetical protein